MEKARLSSLDQSFAVISFQPNGTIIHANENFLATVGYSLNEIVGNHHRMFCDTQYTNTREYTDFWNDLAAGKSQIDEFKRIKKDGSSVWIQAAYTPVKDNNGRVTRVVKIASDITKQKLKNADFEGQLDAISKSYAVIEFDMTGTILKANDNFVNTLGYRQSDIIGKKHSMFCEESYKNSNEYTQFWRKLNEGNFDSGEYLRLGNNGKEIWIQASYNPIMDIDGKPYKVVKYAQDITARKYMVFSVENTSKELSQSSAELFSSAELLSSSASTTTAESEEASSAIEEISQGTKNVSEK
ncbi:MAG: PAS domain-containing protein [Campylobacterota bacterium]|nr:PAS domain-containing protein [Campylobacterota bacterium]